MATGKKEAKTSLNLTLLMQWAGQGDKLIWRHAGDKELEKMPKASTRILGIY